MAEVFDLSGNKISGPEDVEDQPTPSNYVITMKNGRKVYATGFLLVNPLFIGISDSSNKIMTMFSNTEYSLIEAVPEKASEELDEFPAGQSPQEG